MVLYADEVERFQTALNKTVNEVDKAYLRELQANSHECAALCCRDMKSPTEKLRQCVENCGQELQNAQRIVLQEFDRLEDRFERCLSSCREFVRESSERGEDAVYEGCVRRCVDSNIEFIPDLLKAINRALKKS